MKRILSFQMQLLLCYFLRSVRMTKYMPFNTFASCSHLCCPAQILFLKAWQATECQGSAPTQSSCLKELKKRHSMGKLYENIWKPWPHDPRKPATRHANLPLQRRRTVTPHGPNTWDAQVYELISLNIQSMPKSFTRLFHLDTKFMMSWLLPTRAHYVP